MMRIQTRMRHGCRAALLAIVLAAGLGANAGAVQGQATPEAERPSVGEDPAESRSAAFRAVEGAQQEDVPGGPLLIGAYGIAWLAVLLFIVRIGRLHAATARELERLEQSLGPPEGNG